MPELPDNTCEDHTTFLENEYCNLQNLIYKYDEAISALLTGGHLKYILDTGQTQQSVTRLDLDQLRLTRKEMMKELDNLASRLGKNRSVTTVVPGF